MKIELQNLYSSVYNLLESKLDMIRELEDLRHEVYRLSGNTDSETNWAYLLEDLQQEIDDVNLEYVLGFIDDIEEKINDLPYKEQRAIQKMRMTVNPLLKNTPVYFDAANPPSLTDYYNYKKE